MVMPWRWFILLCLLFFLLINLFFAALYSLSPQGLAPVETTYWQNFFFSVQTFTTVGYGALSPQNYFTGFISSIEAFTGVFSTALMTGLMFSKYSRPTAKILFADKILLTSMHGKKSIVARLANTRANRIMNADLSLTMLIDEKTPEGVSIRRFYDLPLVRPRTPIFALGLLVTHEVAPGSVLDHLIANQQSDIELLVSMEGHDETLGQTIYATKMYRYEEINFGGRFADILKRLPDGTRVLDFEPFHKIVDVKL